MSFSSNRLVFGAVAGTICAGFLAGCNDNQNTTEVLVPKDAFIVTTPSDYSSSAISIVGNETPYLAANTLIPTDNSDADIFTNEKYLYRVERSKRESITKYDVSAFSGNDAPIWQFSTRAEGEVTSNVHDLVFASPTKAYMLRYDRKDAWIVNPSATNQATFKTSTLDFSDYADADGKPEMDHGVIVNCKLFVILQRFDRRTMNWIAGDAYAAVVDVSSDMEIDTANNGLHKGILLPIQDPESIQYNAESGKIFVSGVGSYSDDSKVSGLVEIDPTTYAVRIVLNPKRPIAGSPAYKRISGSIVISSTKGYFIDYADWNDNALYAFNPTTGLVDPAPISGLQHKSLANLAYNATSGLWVGNQSDHGVVIIDTNTNRVSATVDTILNPGTIRFIEK